MHDSDSIENNRVHGITLRSNSFIGSNGISTNSDMNGHDHVNDVDLT